MSHERDLAIAKAALSATLFRPDPTPLTRPQVESLFTNLFVATNKCTRPNVQTCKDWILSHIAPSTTRAAALGRFLLALTNSFDRRRYRLHVLYIISDVAHHARGDVFSTAWAEHLPHLMASAFSFKNCPRHQQKLKNLVDLWDERGSFPPSLIAKLRAGDVAPIPASKPALEYKVAKETPYILPSLHGDPSTPWFDLPASTWLPHITPNSTRPLLPSDIRPIQLRAGPADADLISAVQTLLSDVDLIFSKERGSAEDEFDELGERIVLDEITGDVVGGETYYGWSRGFCEKMKERRRNRDRRLPSRSRSSRSDSRSPVAMKRRRYSTSPSRSPSPRRFHNSSPRRRSPSPKPQYNQPPPPPPPSNFPIPQPFPPIPPPPGGYQGPWPPPPPPQMMPQSWASGWGVPPPPPQGFPPQIQGGGSPPQSNFQQQGGNFRGGFRGRGRGYGGGRGW